MPTIETQSSASRFWFR